MRLKQQARVFWNDFFSALKEPKPPIYIVEDGPDGGVVVAFKDEDVEGSKMEVKGFFFGFDKRLNAKLFCEVLKGRFSELTSRKEAFTAGLYVATMFWILMFALALFAVSV
jgi:hypothetical protein